MSPHLPALTGQEVLAILHRRGFVAVRQSGSHVIVRRGDGRRTTVPVHAGRTLGMLDGDGCDAHYRGEIVATPTPTPTPSATLTPTPTATMTPAGALGCGAAPEICATPGVPRAATILLRTRGLLGQGR